MQPRPSHKKAKRSRRFSGRIRAASILAFIERFSSATAQVLAQPAVAQQLTAMGLSVGHMSAQQLASRERAYTQVWRKLIQESGFQPQ